MNDFRETLYTIDKGGNRKWVYAAHVAGRIFSLRTAVAYVLMAIYLCIPWISINGEQGIHLDIPARRFVFFGSVFWATDTIYLVLVLASLGICLFLFTSLLGRVWCGWACPETVFLEFLFRPVERLVEGSAAARLRLDQSPWTLEKIFKKSIKLGIYAIFAWVLASTFLAYFVGREPLLRMMTGSPFAHPVPFMVTLAGMAVMLFQFGWFREQFCTIVCPYARFQSVLLDSESLIVGYDYRRGEPRGKTRKGAAERAVGDCVDCGLCVRVCPTGIDIRNGTQLECLHCAACIDACNSVMEKLGRSPGLIRYSTERSLTGAASRWLRPRVFVYVGILSILLALFSYRLASRQMLDITILRGAADVPYSTMENGQISNHLTLHIGNKSRQKTRISIEVIDPAGITAISPLAAMEILPESMQNAPLFLNFPSSILDSGKRNVRLLVTADSGYRQEHQLTVLGPDTP